MNDLFPWKSIIKHYVTTGTEWTLKRSRLNARGQWSQSAGFKLSYLPEGQLTMTCIYTLCTWTLKSTRMSSSHPITSWKWFGHQETCEIRSSSSSSPPPPSSSSSSSCCLIHGDWNHYNHHHHHRQYHHRCHDLCRPHPHNYHANNTEVGQKNKN